MAKAWSGRKLYTSHELLTWKGNGTEIPFLDYYRLEQSPASSVHQHREWSLAGLMCLSQM